MFDYLQQFNNLPKNLRDQASSPAIMAIISELEEKYKVDLAIVVMKVMVKNIVFSDLHAYMVDELKMTPEDADKLILELKEKVFAPFTDYLGLSPARQALNLDKKVAAIMTEAALALPSAVAVKRFENIISTYIRGVRSKIDTKNSLSKDAKIGGLNLNPDEVDRVFKACAAQLAKDEPMAAPASPSSMPVAAKKLAQIIGTGNRSAGGEYNLKKSLMSGQTKSVASTLDTAHELEAPAEQLDLPEPELLKRLESAPVPLIDLPLAPEKKAAPQPSPVLSVPDSADELEIILPPKQVAGQSAPATSREAIKPVSSVSPTTPIKPAAGFKSVNPLTRPAAHLEPLKSGAPLAPVSPAVASIAPAPAVAKKGVNVPTPEKPKPVAQTPGKIVPAPKSVTAARSMAGRQAPAPSSTRPQMHDIKPVPKVMGPIEELQYLDVVNFRRLGSTPAEMTAKVFSKIKLLEKDGYDRMVAGVHAWRQSPVCRLYLRLGQEAIAKGKPLKEIVSLRQEAKQEYLSMDEIEAVVSLNGKLVF